MRNTILLGLAFCLCIAAMQAQNTVRWEGGTPGSETKWEAPKNWIPHCVPSTNDLVVIPDCSSKGGFYPELTKTTVSIAHLRVESGAAVTIRSGAKLLIDGSTTYNEGIILYGTIRNEGYISIRNTGLQGMAGPDGHFLNKGVAEITHNGTENPLARY